MTRGINDNLNIQNNFCLSLFNILIVNILIHISQIKFHVNNNNNNNEIITCAIGH